MDGDRGGDNIYSFMGSAVHDIVERMIKGELPQEEALNLFHETISDAEVLGYEWMSDNIREKYTYDIADYIKHFSPHEYIEPHIEDYFNVDIAGYTFQGYIDCWFERGDGLIIEDFKTSSKYSKADLEAHSLQLAIYARALESIAAKHDKHIILRFNMLKYTKIGKKMVERFDSCEDGGDPAFVEVKYDDALKERLDEWVMDTTERVNALEPSLYYRWPKGKTPAKDFFCKNLCSHYERCNGMAG